MITRTPYDRDNLKIGKKDKVLEVGPGHSPTFRSNVLVDLFVDSNYHRCGNLKIYPHQQFINANGEALPFKDKEFDYVICNQVLEHAENPAEFIREQCRVAKRGYMETPSLLGEFLFPKKSHKWIILHLDNKLILFEKSRMPGNYENNYGELFLNYLPYQSLTYKLLWYSFPVQGLAGMMVWQDSVGNICGRYEGQQEGAPAVLLGSHLDTVRNAGRYDGMLGVLAAIEVVQRLHQQGRRLAKAIEIVGFGDEEGTRFGITLLGSRGVTGTWPESWLSQCDTDGVSVAQALLNEPEILILDEPTSGLDPGERVRFRNLLSEFAHDRIVLISTHIVPDVEYIAMKNAVMKDGKIIETGTTPELVKRMEGKVFSEKIPARALADYEKKLCIVNLKNEPDGDITIRYLGDRPETEDSVSEEPRLEDLYLWLFPQNTDGRKTEERGTKGGKRR